MVRTVKPTAKCNYFVKAPLRETNLILGLLVALLPLLRDTWGKCSLCVRGKLYGYDVGIVFTVQSEAQSVRVCVHMCIGAQGGCLGEVCWCVFENSARDGGLCSHH